MTRLEMCKAAGRWKALANIGKVLRRAGQTADPSGGLARTKQSLGAKLQVGFDPLAGREPGWALKQDVGAYRRRLESGLLHQGNPSLGRKNFFRGQEPEVSSEKFFQRTGVPIEQAPRKALPTTMGDSVYRGGFGVDPWGGGYYGGVLIHGTPARALAYQYGRGRNGVGMVHHFKAAPRQIVGADFALEHNMISKVPGRGVLPMERLQRGQALYPETAHYELPLTRGNNPYQGTELVRGDQSRYVAAGDQRGQRALQNYGRNMTEMMPDTITDGSREWRTLSANPRLQRLAQTNRDKFNELMRRRAAELFGQ